MEIKAFVHPKSKNPRVERKQSGDLHIHIQALPILNQANKAAITALAEYLKIKKHQIKLVKGLKSKQKIFQIE